MAELSKTVKVIQRVVGVDCPYCALDRAVGHKAQCVHFVIPFVDQEGGQFYAAIDPQDGEPPLRLRTPFATFDEAADAANKDCRRFSDRMGAVVRVYVPLLADGGRLRAARSIERMTEDEGHA